DQNLVVLSAEGPAPLVAATSEGIAEAAAGVEHTPVDEQRIRSWFEHLNWGADKIEAEKQAMLRTAHLGYTTEVSADWSRTAELYEAVMTRIRDEFPRAGDLTLLGAHSSHSYQTGTNLYVVYDYDIGCEPREEINEYHLPLNAIIVEEALRVGGSMVHHHGVGKYRTPWMHEEHGTAYDLLAGLKAEFDPHGVMNPGSLFPIDADGRSAPRGIERP
ncbi:MAG: FAD-binding oxidoreductase, partial [Actinomycetia bacterium]|nr:FAD-binding oxidoreductase [Actinomycetes bacterium]